MTEFDFSQLRDLKTPENWVENAINIPQKNQKQPIRRIPFYWIGAAAALLVIAAVVTTLLLNAGDPGNPVSPLQPKPVLPVTSATSATAADSTAASPSTVPTDASGTGVPATASSTGQVPATGAAAPLPSAAQPSAAAAAPTEKPTTPSVPPTPAPTVTPPQPTQATTQTAIEPATEGEQSDIEPQTGASPGQSDWFRGKVVFDVGWDSAFITADSLTVDIIGEEEAYSGLTVPLRTTGYGAKSGVLLPYDMAILLPAPASYQLTVSDGAGHTQTWTVDLAQADVWLVF